MRAIETSTPERTPRRPRFRTGLAGLVGVLFVAAPTPALAFPEFPGIIVDELNRTAGPGKPGITCIPTCSLCHTSPSPDRANAATKFANSLLLFRSSPIDGTMEMYPDDINPDTLPLFLQLVETKPCANMNDPACVNGVCNVCDADGDSDPDIAELRVNSDPNVDGGLLACPKYGCGARIAPEGSSRPLDGTAALAALSAAIVFVRRLRRR